MDVAYAWLEERKDFVKPSTYALYRWDVEKVFSHYFQTIDGSFDDQVQRFALSQWKQGLKPKTIKDRISLIRAIYEFGSQKGWWPFHRLHVQYPTFEERNTLSVLEIQEQKSLLRYLDEHLNFHNLGLMICLEEGLRIGEICSLRFMDIDAERGVVHVRHTIQRIYSYERHRSELHIDRPKTSNSEREIPMTKSLQRKVASLQHLSKPDHYVLTNGEKPLEPRAFRAYFSRLLKRLQLSPIRFHGLRHSFATRCVEAGCDYKTLSAILGHANIGTTLNLYVHPDHEQKMKCINQMMERLGRKES